MYYVPHMEYGENLLEDLHVSMSVCAVCWISFEWKDWIGQIFQGLLTNRWVVLEPNPHHDDSPKNGSRKNSQLSTLLGNQVRIWWNNFPNTNRFSLKQFTFMLKYDHSSNL